MKRRWLLSIAFFIGVFFRSVWSQAAPGDSSNLRAREKALWKEWAELVPPQRHLNVQQFKALYDRVMSGQEKAYLIDVRSTPEFYAGHIIGTDHVDAGHVYTIPKRIPDKDAKIVVWCRTRKRGSYAGGWLVKYGYTNVWIYDGGIVGWIKAGLPLCNQFMGIFRVIEYHKEFKGVYKKGPKAGKEKDPYKIRIFHPY